MFSKRPLPKTEELIASKRLRENLIDLYASNIVSADRAGSLLQDALAAGAANVKDLASIGSAKNRSRNLRAKLLKRSQWPGLYYAKVRLFNPQRQKVLKSWLPMFLPHELIASLLQQNDLQTLCSISSAGEATKQRITELAQQYHLDNVIGFGFWGDGVPANWDRSESYEVLSMNLPGVPKLRLPLTAVSKRFWRKETLDDIMAIMAWSCEQAFLGLHPTQRHDGSAFNAAHGDAKRKKMASKPLGFQGFLEEVRADWAWYQSALRFPAHNTKLGCCWKCGATPMTIRQTGLNAEWRCGVSPLFSAPTASVDICMIDWLHVMDKGMTASFLGNLLWLIMPLLRGNNLAERCSCLFLEIQQWYRDHETTDRFQNLVPTMIKQPKKGPELRGNAAQIRGLVPCGAYLAQKYLGDQEPASTVKHAAALLAGVYDNLSRDKYNNDDIVVKTRQFVTLMAALEATSTHKHLWRFKPKFHLALHLTESKTNPADTWTYRDEDFGGAVAALTRRRGGPSTPLAAARRMLNCFTIKHKIPVL